MTDPGALLQITQPLLFLPSILLFPQGTFNNIYMWSPADCDEEAGKDLCAAHSPFNLRRNTQKYTPLLKEEHTQHSQAQVWTYAQFLVS